MKVGIIGSGGREHSICCKLKESKKIQQIYCFPGNAGTAELANNVDIDLDNFTGFKEFILKNKIDLIVVGPEKPLVNGIVDFLEENNIKVFGPNKIASQLEGSKIFTKKLCKKHNIPTANYHAFTNYQKANEFIQSHKTYPIVIKADGLAAGKGVTIATSQKQAEEAIKDCLINQKFNDAGSEIIIEEFLEGDEASIFAFTDSKVMLPMLAAQDHKAVGDGDTGPNTGGMGAYCPTPLVTPELYQKITETIYSNKW